jgi:hypothetical protein
MSGGYFDYNQYRIDEIADTLERIIRGASNLDSPPSDEYSGESSNSWAKCFLAECSPETLQEFKSGLVALKLAAAYAQRIDWLLSGDDGEESFHRRLQEDLKQVEEQYKDI